ncbi:MAG: urea transporter, partial [Duncaniella sp.]|nr:urea transporter [Duncaniella sp.]
MATTSSTPSTSVVKEFPRTFLRGAGQVMFQDNAWTGLLFI